MPGISMMFGWNLSEKMRNAWEVSLQRILFDNGSKVLFQAYEGDALISVSGFPSYPFQVFNDMNTLYVLEGRIYDPAIDPSFLVREVHRLVKINDLDALRDLLIKIDGEFLIVILPKEEGGAFIVGDPYSHLPFYYGSNGKDHYVSREILNPVLNMDDLEKDRLGIAQYMLFSFCLSNRTFFKDIKRSEPGTILRIDPESKLTVDRYFHLDHSRNLEKKGNEKELLDTTIEEFSKAMKLRANAVEGVPVLSLSGGLDSRAIASWFLANDRDFSSISFSDGTGHAGKDLEMARKLSNTFKKNLVEVELDRITGKVVMSLLEMKGGLNDLGLARLLSYYKRISERLPGTNAIFTGDSGTAVRFRYPRHTCHDLEDVINELFYLDGRFFKTPLFTISEVSEITSLSSRSLISSIKQELLSYPEKDWDGRFSHFYYENYAYKWHYEGIDRMRHFIWPMNPLESTPLLGHIFTVPNDHLWGLKHYLHMIRSIHPGAADVPYANWTMHPDSMKFKLGKMKENIYRNTPKGIRNMVKVLKGKGPDPMSIKNDDLIRKIKGLTDGDLNISDLDEGLHRRCGWNFLSSSMGFALGSNDREGIEKRLSPYLVDIGK